MARLCTRPCDTYIIITKTLVSTAGIAQLGEQQTEVLEVACSIHAPGI